MPDSPLPNPPIDVVILIKAAQAARVAAHIRVVLSRFKSHMNLSRQRVNAEECVHHREVATLELAVILDKTLQIL